MPTTFWHCEGVGHNQEAKKELSELFAQDTQLFSTPKPERILQRILTIATNPGDIVCDPFLGSGTTASVAHKMGRRWLGVEMGEHAVTHCVPRLRKVIEGERGGISEAVNWEGGGGFRFYRLGPAITDERGHVNKDIRFPVLAAHIWFSETHTPLVKASRSPLLGVHNGTAIYLLYNGILGDKRSNTLNSRVLRDLPPHDGPRTIFAECTALDDERLRILDIADFAQLTPQDLRDKACIVISTFAALRVEDTDGRKVYSHTEALEPHFAAVPPNVPGLELHTDGKEAGKIKCSFANIMALIRPLVIVDEAHNNKSDLSVEVLQRVRAGCIIEYTATPAGDSNVLYHVSASELKTWEMIKLPIILTEHPTWQEVLTDSVLRRRKLGEVASKEPEFVRPIVLIQAESKDKEVTVEVVKKYLIEQGKVEEDRIAIATGSQRELDDVKLMDPACKIEFVITVQALKEGWDCPFAYVFCSVATVHSKKDVEQLLGRVLRMPYAKKRTQEELNRAYAFVSKTGWPQAVAQLHDRLVNMGFDEIEAANYVKSEPSALPGMEPAYPEPLAWTLTELPALETVPADMRSQVSVTRDADGTYVLSVNGPLTPDGETRFVAAMPVAVRDEVRRSLAARREGILAPTQPRPPPSKIEPMRAPQLCLWVDGQWEPAQEEHFLSPDSWSLLDYRAELTEAEFRVEETTDRYLIDIQGKRLIERYLGSQDVFDFADVPSNWTELELSRELDRPLRQKDIRQELLLEFIRKTVCGLVTSRGMSLTTLVRVRAALERALRQKILTYRQAAKDKGYQLRLFGPEAVVETKYEYAFVFDPENYPAKAHYQGSFQFEHHFCLGMVAAFDSDEELECAKAIDMCPRVKRWARNVPGMFSLPTSTGRFYPDFVAELVDGLLLIVEYKGAHLVEYEQEKKNIGERWASTSGGKGVFLWAVKKDAAGRDVGRQLEDAVRGTR